MAEETDNVKIIENLKAKIVEFEKKEKHTADKIQALSDHLRDRKKGFEESYKSYAVKMAERFTTTDEESKQLIEEHFRQFLEHKAQCEALEYVLTGTNC